MAALELLVLEDPDTKRVYEVTAGVQVHPDEDSDIFSVCFLCVTTFVHEYLSGNTNAERSRPHVDAIRPHGNA